MMLETLATPGTTPGATPGDTSWFTQDRFGLFIHWGLYALPARHEWVKSYEKITDQDYAKYFNHFDPDLYDPDKWADAATNAGMKYFVITTKHHEGFCLWDSKLTDYKAPKSPAGRDLLRPMVDAFRQRDMRVGFYHSLIDWQHRDYFVDTSSHPRRDDDVAALNQGRDQQKYIDYLHGQVRELLSDFGAVDVLWFDFSFVDKKDRLNFAKGKGREAWGSEDLVKLVRELQPNIVLNDRLDLPATPPTWDIKTPEQTQPREWVRVDGQPVVWEACQTLSGSWGYHRDEQSWRSTRQLITTLIDCVSKGGNLLLNVGPTGRGELDYRALDRLEGIGKWMRNHARSIYGCTQAPDAFAAPQHCLLTYNPQKHRLYVHLLNWPYHFLHLSGQAFTERVEYAQFLHDASEVKLGMDDWHVAQVVDPNAPQTLALTLPQREPEGVEITVIELFLKA